MAPPNPKSPPPPPPGKQQQQQPLNHPLLLSKSPKDLELELATCHAMTPTALHSNITTFLWSDPSIQPSALLCALEADDADLMERILSSTDLEDSNKTDTSHSSEGAELQARAEQAGGSAQRGEGDTMGVGSSLDHFVEYTLTLCFSRKSYKCLRVLVTRLAAVREALEAGSGRWRGFLGDEGEIRRYLSGA